MPPGFSAADFYNILPEIVLTSGALLVLVTDVVTSRASRPLLGRVTLAVLGATILALLPFHDADTLASQGLLAIDGFAFFFKLLFLLAAVITVLMSASYLDVEGLRAGEYYFLILCATLGMMFMASGIDLITIFVGLETMAVAFYILVGFLKPNRRSNEASVKYFLLGAFSLGILLFGMSTLYGLSGTTNLRELATALAAQERGPLLIMALVLVVAGIGFKIAAVPFHMWAPDVYEGAPTPITAFLSVGSKAAAVAMLLRIFVEGLPFLADVWQPLFWVLAVLTMTVGNLAALTQSNVKRMLAYSSIAHAGYVLIGVVAGTTRGVTAILVYMVVYAFMQLGAFRRYRDASAHGRRGRRVERSERALFSTSGGRLRDAVLHAVARWDPPDGRFHGQVLAVRCGHRVRVRVARGDRCRQQRDLAVLLRPGHRVHVVQ